MRGSRVKVERGTVYQRRANAVRPGRRHGGPGKNNIPYPKSIRLEKMGDFDVVVTDIETVREAAK